MSIYRDTAMVLENPHFVSVLLTVVCDSVKELSPLFKNMNFNYFSLKEISKTMKANYFFFFTKIKILDTY